MKNVKVSIITVTYNVVDTIEQTLNSVLDQSYDNIEYIVVDGLSTDGTWEKICKYRDRISVLIHEKDAGLYDAMNKGIIHATGDIIGIVNGDDWYEKDALVNVVSNFQKDTDILYARMNIIGYDGKIQKISLPDKIDDIWYCMIPHPTVFVRKSIYDKYGAFDLKYHIAADYEMMFRFYLSGARFRYIDRVITNFRRGGLTTQRQLACAKEVREISLLHIDKCPEKDKYLPLITNAYNRVKLVASYEQSSEDFKRMLDLLLESKLDVLCIFGAGAWGKKCAEKLKQCNLLCNYFIDNNSDKWGTLIDSIKVLSPEQLEKMECNIIIALADGYDEIEKQLAKMKNKKLHWIKMFDLYEETF